MGKKRKNPFNPNFSKNIRKPILCPPEKKNYFFPVFVPIFLLGNLLKEEKKNGTPLKKERARFFKAVFFPVCGRKTMPFIIFPLLKIGWEKSGKLLREV